MTITDETYKPVGRFISPKECAEVYARVQKLSKAAGSTRVFIEGIWNGNIRWGRNEIISCGDVRNNTIKIQRNENGAKGEASTSTLSNSELDWAITKANRLLQFTSERPETDFAKLEPEPFQLPNIWFDSTFNLLAKDRAEVVDSLVSPAEKEGLMAAGYIQVSGRGRSINQPGVEPIFIRFTQAQLSVTVRDPKGKGSGWAGVDRNDWNQIDGKKLMAIAIDKCLRSLNPVGIEPGRYNTVLEPQAVHEIGRICFNWGTLRRLWAEDRNQPSPYSGSTPRTSKIGLRLFDERLTVTHDPMDPDCSFPPISDGGQVYNRAVWVEKGVLKNLEYSRTYGIQSLGINSSLKSSSAYSMSGGTMSIEEMVERTERGLFVTRFSNVGLIDNISLLQMGYTRDGLWLIEKGKISKAVKNMKFTDSPFHTFNNIVEIGVPQRVFSPDAPAVVPPIMSRDFSFTATIEAI